MSFRIDKVVAALPGTLEPDTLYAVRAGAGFDLYMTDALGQTAHPLNSGGGGSPAPLGLWDYWQEYRFGIATAPQWVGAAISSGSNNTAIPAAALAGYNPNGVFLRSSTTANGGYRYQTTSLVSDYFGARSHKFRCAFRWRTAFAGRLVRLGYLDTASSADVTDGAYFEIDGAGTCTAKAASNNARTANPTTVALALDIDYTFDIEAEDASAVRFRVYAGTSETAIFDVTIATNIPATSARTFGNGIVATESSVTASDIGILYMLGEGTLAGFERARG